MAENSISIPVSKDNSISLLAMPDGRTTAIISRDLALRFQKKHKEVLRTIERIRSMVPKDFYERNFALIEVDVVLPHSGGIRKDPAYLLSRDAFSLLAMGFTGKWAIQWKIKYIEAFNTLETSALEYRTELARESGYQQGLKEARALPAVKAESQAAYLEGMKEGKKLAERRDGLRLILRAKGYLEKGLTKADTARCLGISRQYLQKLLGRATALGV